MFAHPLVRSNASSQRRWPLRNHQLPLFYRLDFDDVGRSPAIPGSRDSRLAMVEAVLLAADEPVTAKRLAALTGLTDAAEARRQLARLRELYDADGSAFQIEELAGGYQLLTRPEFHPWLVRCAAPARKHDCRPLPAKR